MLKKLMILAVASGIATASFAATETTSTTAPAIEKAAVAPKVTAKHHQSTHKVAHHKTAAKTGAVAPASK